MYNRSSTIGALAATALAVAQPLYNGIASRVLGTTNPAGIAAQAQETKLAANVEIPKSNAMHYFRQGLDLVLKKEYDKALEMYAKGVALDPKVNRFPEFQSTEAHAIYQKAFSIKERDQEQALQLFSQASKIEPTNPGPYNEIGGILARAGKMDEAQNYFMAALNAQPNFISSVISLGVYLTKAQRPQEANFFLELILTLEPNTSHKAAIANYISFNRKLLAGRS